MGDKILIVAHNHPDFSPGGGEIAARTLFLKLLDCGYDAYFMAKTGMPSHNGVALSAMSEREYLLHTEMDDPFCFSNIMSQHLAVDFQRFLVELAPNVVHFHHYVMGIESLVITRNTLPECRIILTLHEYLAICHNHGQMVKTSGKQLCHSASVKHCHQCFPEKTPADFFYRERYIKQAFDVVDLFLAPSHFLRQRYIDWGLPEDKITYLENYHSPKTPLPGRDKERTGDGIRFAYFGQFTPFKGVDLLIEAFEQLPKRVAKRCSLHFFGSRHDGSIEIGKKQKSLSKHQIYFHGRYELCDMPQLMTEVDWVVVPSIWWENSPMVIQEALALGRPLIVSNIGGMAEKVAHAEQGIHFQAGDPISLKQALIRACDDELWNQYHNNIVKLSIGGAIESYIECYGLRPSNHGW